MTSARHRGAVRRTAAAVRLLLSLQRRSGFLYVYAGTAVATVLIVRLAVPESWYGIMVPALLLGEYGTMGIFMTAIHRYLERIEGSSAALLVTPLTPAEHCAAMILAPALVATVAGTAVHAGVLGLGVRSALLVLPLFLTALLAGITGIVMSSRYRELTRFLIAVIPVTTVFSLPYLSLFQVTPRWSFIWLPWDAALFSFWNLCGDEPELWLWSVLVVALLAFVSVGSLLAQRSFRLHLQEEVP